MCKGSLIPNNSLTGFDIFRGGEFRCLVRDGLIRTPLLQSDLNCPVFCFINIISWDEKSWYSNPRCKFDAYCCTLKNCPFKTVQLIDNILILWILLQDTKLDQYFAKWPGFCSLDIISWDDKFDVIIQDTNLVLYALWTTVLFESVQLKDEFLMLWILLLNVIVDQYFSQCLN